LLRHAQNVVGGLFEAKPTSEAAESDSVDALRDHEQLTDLVLGALLGVGAAAAPGQATPAARRIVELNDDAQQDAPDGTHGP
jgi:hypothetical protein